MTITVHFDGACIPNPGGVASYGLIIRQGDRLLWEASERVPDSGAGTSNNLAEYAGLIAALRYLIDNGLNKERIIINGDSQLVIKQMFGRWKIKRGCYAELAHEAKTLLTLFPRIDAKWVPRDRNTVADELSKAAINPALPEGTVIWGDTWDDVVPSSDPPPWE
jgi:ribonuclease HI